MKKIIAITLVSIVAMTGAVYAQSVTDEKVKADVQALDKDNAALAKDRQVLATDRAAKADDKANDDSGKQAVDSMKIGAVKTTIEEKKTERDIDKKILAHDKAEMNKNDANSAPASSN